MISNPTTRPIPKRGEVIRTLLPDRFAGIRYEIARMAKYIRESAKAPIVREKARELRDEREHRARPGIRTLRKLHAWGAAHFVYMDDPPNVQVLETPMRMLRKLKVPESAMEGILAPFGSPTAQPPIQTAKITGTSAGSSMLILALAGAAGFRDIRLRLGGSWGTLHYAWGQVKVGKRWIDVDILHPEFGKHHPFECYEHLDPKTV